MVLGVLVAVLSGCGGDVAGPTGADVPAPEPPTVRGVDSQPPPAWVEGPSGSSWMAYGSYCWEGACVDMVPPSLRDDIPTVEVRQGQEVIFHFGFEPSEVQLSFASDDGNGRVSLPAQRQVSWEVTHGGFLNLFTRTGGRGGDASYDVQLVVEPSASPDMD